MLSEWNFDNSYLELPQIFFSKTKPNKFNNLTIENFCTQREFLLTYGIKLREKIISKKSTSDKKKMIKKGVERIIGENDMGTLFKVLILRKKNVS